MSEEGRTGLFTHSVVDTRRFSGEMALPRIGKMVAAACTEFAEVMRFAAIAAEDEAEPLPPPGRHEVAGGTSTPPCGGLLNRLSPGEG